jgi:predicted phosphodiesterase
MSEWRDAPSLAEFPTDPKRIGIIADTHGLLRPQAMQALAGVDVILHAGDIGDPGILDRLAALAPLHTLRGNIHREPWAATLPETVVIPLGSNRA